MVRWFILALFSALILHGTARADPDGRIRVIDADTLDVGGVRVRLFGIDAPEQRQTCRRTADNRQWACGRWATEAAKKALNGKQARCKTVDTDQYGRVVAVCSVGGVDVGKMLIANGLAGAYTAYSRLYVDDEKAARVTGRGIFSSTMLSPEAFRARQNQPARQAAPGTCTIKGNISKGGRIYHVPGQEHYDRTRINTGKGERWFCSEAAARRAGWRRARR